MRRLFVGFFRAINNLLQHPLKVFWACAFLFTVNFVLDGSVFQLWSLHQDRQQIQKDIATLKEKSVLLKTRLKKAKDPAFLEREARDRFDLVSADDLVFVFSDDH